MPLIRLDKVSLNFGTHILMDEVNFTVRKGEKIGLLGRNGSGKTTLMKLLAGQMQPESGERWLRPGVKLAWLEQSLPEGSDMTVYDMVAGGLAEIGELLKQFHHLTADYHEENLPLLERVQTQLEAKHGWTLGQKVDTVISQLQLPADQLMSELSGGWRKRVALARALVTEPEFLLLDEPTNHLDVLAIEWLEKQLQEFNGAILLVTHDRTFLQNIANCIVELDRGHLYQFDGSYARFLAFREQQLAAEETANRLFDKRLAEEEVWIRQGIKARRTRNEGRVRALEAMRRERSERRVQAGAATFKVQAAANSGKIVAELIDVSQRFDDKQVISKLSTTIMRGDRIGLVGANGSGKSTLLKIILGQLTPTAGSVKLGTKLEVAYFDQLRMQLDLEKNLIDNVCGGQEYIDIHGKRKHAITYLNEFLFTPDRIRTPAKALSGGEQNRAILAKVFSRPANVLVLDEPTNDLDIETLELLEDLLMTFDGTVLLVSHDRQFMDNVVTSIMVFDGAGGVNEFVGGYSDWASKGGSLASAENRVPVPEKPDKTMSVASGTSDKASKPRKLSYKDQRELEALPALIEKLEKQQALVQELIASPEFFGSDSKQKQDTLKQLAELQATLQATYQRWEQLEQL